MEASKYIPAADRKAVIDRVIATCRNLADRYVAEWKPLNYEWETAVGCAYLRLSDDNQVVVDKGSMEQQVNIVVSEVVSRSNTDKINYRITKFFIEPGITGRDDRRPEFQMMQREIKRGQHRFVVIKELSRIARNARLWKEFFQLCIEKNTEVMIRGFPFNPNDPTSILQLDILAVFAEYESNVNSKRLRESNFSAMITSGKFNSTHLVLGLDQLTINGVAKVGFYVANPEEIKIVEWVMTTFVRYESYQKTLEEIERHQILNKNGRTFKKHSLDTLLTNLKYIGKWIVNEDNKDKPQNKLMAYERFEEIDLPHGCVIDKKLWDQVQVAIAHIAGQKYKNTNIRKVYPLSGLLRYKDGTPFHGTGAWGRTTHMNYYHNATRGIRIAAEVLENDAKRAASEIISGSPAMQDAIRRRCSEVDQGTRLLAHQEQKLVAVLEEMRQEREHLDRRLDFILREPLPAAEETSFRDEYRGKLTAIIEQTQKTQQGLTAIRDKKQELNSDSFDLRQIGPHAKKVLDLIGANDPVALKASYRELFETIVIGDLDKDGKRELEYVLKSDGSEVSRTEEKTSNENKMAGWIENLDFYVISPGYTFANYHLLHCCLTLLESLIHAALSEAPVNSDATLKTSGRASCGNTPPNDSSISLSCIPFAKHSRINDTDNRVSRIANLPPSNSGSFTIHLYCLYAFGTHIFPLSILSPKVYSQTSESYTPFVPGQTIVSPHIGTIGHFAQPCLKASKNAFRRRCSMLIRTTANSGYFLSVRVADCWKSLSRVKMQV
jgi:DNA invertase Pin-like site-specific DNA recombinase